MSNVSPVNIQQILQMGTHTEKLQQTVQHLPQTTGYQQNEERKLADEIKRTSVQDMEFSNPSETVNRDGKRRQQVRTRGKNVHPEGKEELPTRTIINERKNQGRSIDLMI